MEIQAWCVLGWEVPSSGEDFLELLVGKFASLLEAIHGTSDFNVDEAVGCYLGSEVIVLYDVRREIGIWDAHIFEPVEGRVEVHVGDVHSHPLGFQGGEHAVEMNFDGFKTSGVGASLTGVVGDEIASSCDSSAIGIIFFRSVGAYSSSVGDCSTVGDLLLVDEEDGIGAFDIA